MKKNIDKLKKILGDLSKVTDAERLAIAKRAFDQIATLSAQKEALLADFDAVTTSLEASDISQELMQELNNVRTRAEENASALATTASGVREARKRLRKIREADFNTGAYRADGAALRDPNASTIAAKA